MDQQDLVKQKQEEIAFKNKLSNFVIEDWDSLKQQGFEQRDHVSVEQKNAFAGWDFMEQDLKEARKEVKPAVMTSFSIATPEEYSMMSAAAKSKYKKDMKAYKKMLEAQKKKALAEKKKAEAERKKALAAQKKAEKTAKEERARLQKIKAEAEKQLQQKQLTFLKKDPVCASLLKQFSEAKTREAQEAIGEMLLLTMAKTLMDSREFSEDLAVKYGEQELEGLAYGAKTTEDKKEKDRIRDLKDELFTNAVIQNVLRPLLPKMLKKSAGLSSFAGAMDKKTKNRAAKENDKWLAKKAYELTKADSLIQVMPEQEIEEKNQSMNLYSGLSEKQWKESGGCTYRKIVPAAEAERLVEKSHGFLCAVKVKTAPGVEPSRELREIRPSLPETMNIKGKDVKVRKGFNLLIKSYITMVTNPDGSLKTDKDTQRIVDAFDTLTMEFGDYAKDQREVEKAKKILNETFGPVMQELLQAEYKKKGKHETKENVSAEVAGLCDDFLYLAANLGEALFAMEISLGSCMTNARNLMNVDVNKMFDHLRTLKIKERKTGEDGKEIMVERAPTEEEIATAFQDSYADLEKMSQSLKQVRELEIDGKEVPILNACSANGDFYAKMGKVAKGERKFVRYQAEDYTLAQPEKVRQYLLKNIDLLSQGENVSPEELDKYKKKLNDMSFSPTKPFESREESKEINDLCEIAGKFTKFPYHVAAHISEDAEDGLVTIEGFAAENTQYVVEPFTMHSSIGQYRGESNETNLGNDTEVRNKSFINYYNADAPFGSNVLDTLKTYMKQVLIKGGFNKA